MKDNPNELFVLDIEKLNSAVEEEVKKMKNLLEEAGVKPEKIAVLEPIIENTVWMRFKLDDAREKIKTASVAIPYNNGGGQKGIRENPLFKGYEALWKSYMNGMNKILEFMPRDVAEAQEEEIERPQNVLELVRARHKKEA